MLQYSCLVDGATYSETQLNNNYETLVRCTDCGLTDPYDEMFGGPPYNVDLTSDPILCQQQCCSATGQTVNHELM